MFLASGVSGTFGFVIAFFGGFLSFVSPCVLPLVPGYVSMISGLSSAEIAAPTPAHRMQLIRTTVLFICGFTIVFVILGASASQAGAFLARHNRIFDQISGAFIILMGAVLTGWLKWRPLVNTKRAYVTPDLFGAATAPLMGMAFAFGWTPCIGAILAPIFALAFKSSTLAHGVWLLFWYSIGLGVPFLLMALAFSKLSTTVGWFRRNARLINIVSGILLMAFGFLLFTDNLTRISNWTLRIMEDLHIGRLG
jgi:cytochrome c-type biogenesis protein